MSNPLRILQTLDQHLSLPGEITLFGRSALALGYRGALVHFHNTQDVDGILPLARPSVHAAGCDPRRIRHSIFPSRAFHKVSGCLHAVAGN
jgi:hypothetical protein